MLRTVADTIASIKHVARVDELPTPPHVGRVVDDRPRIVLGVSSLKNHTSPEGHALIEGLRHAGWQVWGHGYPPPHDCTNVCEIVHRVNPSVVFIYDIREWGKHCGVNDLRDPRAKFTNISVLGECKDIFKVGLVRDAHNSVEECNSSFQEMGVHCWVHTYHPKIVKHLNNGVRSQHLIRSWHSVEPNDVPPFDKHKRDGCLLSGNLGPCYPLRTRLFDHLSKLQKTRMLGHPGLHGVGCQAPKYLDELSKHKVAICTSSIFGYSVRKLIEATAAGCIVVTDLPTDEVVPFIDNNLVRISPEATWQEVNQVLDGCHARWNPNVQRGSAEECKRWHDWREVGLRLSKDIEAMRLKFVNEGS